MITFSLRPAQPVAIALDRRFGSRPRVVSWKLAAEMKLSVFSEALVNAQQHGVNSAGASAGDSAHRPGSRCFP